MTNGSLHCLMDERIFATGTKSLGVENNFYKLQDLTSEEIKLIRLLTVEQASPIARRHYEMVLHNILSPLLLSQQHPELLQQPEVLELLEIHKTNAIDDQHTVIEGKFVPLLARCLKEDITWFDDPQSAIAFCNFIAAQHMRTKAVQSRVIERLRNRIKLDVSRIWGVIGLIYGFNLGCSMFMGRKDRPLILVRNESSMPFVTSDQPVVNLDADGENAPEQMTIYYPISPRLALHIGEPGRPTLPEFGLTEEEIVTLNLQMTARSQRQVYASEMSVLEKIRATRGGANSDLEL